MKKTWKIKQKISDDLLEQLLKGRGLATLEEIQSFLNPEYADLLDPFLMKDMDRAVDRIVRALQNNEKITVYADYDADAVTAAAVLLRFFGKLGYKHISYYIPDRFTEGYGMNPDAVKALADSGTQLIITVDCGINAIESVDKATNLGVDVVITDHHQLTGEIPGAMAVVNPHRPDDTYKFKDLTGVGVAFKLVQGLIKNLQLTTYNLQSGFEKWLLDLVAIGTVADCQSLLGENRILVKWGLLVMEKTRWIGLRKLMELAGIGDTGLDTYKIGFVIAPRINAAGRIEHANLALELLITDDEFQAETLAGRLQDLNLHRQKLTETILSEAREQIAISSDKKILLAAGENWPKGIVGLVAGKLTEEYSRPVFVMEKGEGEATGSARSVGNFNIVEAIAASREILVKYGGHPMAAGFTLKVEHIELFHKNLLKYAEEILSEEDLSPVLHYDSEITPAEITDGLATALEKFAPFGQGNPRPRFRLNNVLPKFPTSIGQNGKHLRFYIEHNNISIGAVGFNLGFWAEKLQGSERIDIICEPQYNYWNGRKKIQLKITDIDWAKNNEK